jgi:hypothetical protein
MLITNPDGHGRRCPVCDERIDDDGGCPRCAENRMGVAASAEVPAQHLQWIADTLRTFILSDKEIVQVKADIASELGRLTPGFFKSVTVAACLRVIQQRSRVFYLSMGVSHADADELASKHVEKIWRLLFGGWPRANAGAWVTSIRSTILADFGRAKKRRRKERELTDAIGKGLQDGAIDEASQNEEMEELLVRSPEFVEQLMKDAAWTQTVAYHQKKLDDAGKDVMSLEWEGQSVPLRNKRRERGPS